MSQSQYRIDYANAMVVAVAAAGGASATVALPANRELFAVAAAVNAHFRFSTAAQATAVATDPMITAGGDTLIVRMESPFTNFSAIGDGAAVGNVSIFPVFED